MGVDAWERNQGLSKSSICEVFFNFSVLNVDVPVSKYQPQKPMCKGSSKEMGKICLSLFFCCFSKMHDKENLRQKRFIWLTVPGYSAHSEEVKAARAGSSWSHEIWKQEEDRVNTLGLLSDAAHSGQISPRLTRSDSLRHAHAWRSSGFWKTVSA